MIIIISINVATKQNKKKSKLITKANWDILLRRRELDDRERFRGAMSWSHSCKVNNLYFIIIYTLKYIKNFICYKIFY